MCSQKILFKRHQYEEALQLAIDDVRLFCFQIMHLVTIAQDKLPQTDILSNIIYYSNSRGIYMDLSNEERQPFTLLYNIWRHTAAHDVIVYIAEWEIVILLVASKCYTAFCSTWCN